MINVAKPMYVGTEVDAIKEVLKSGRLSNGPKCKEFGEKFANYCGAKYGVPCSSGTAALQTALRCLDIGYEDEVIVPAMSFFATVEATFPTFATPIFVDVDEYGCMDPKRIEAAITPRTKAIIVVHLYGIPCDMDAIMLIAQKHKLYVIEDAAQAHGAEYKGRKVGSIGHVGCFSFFATKNITTLGEGGMIVTNDKDIADTARNFTSHGMLDRNTHGGEGYNFRMTEAQAAFGIEQLKMLDVWNKQRANISKKIYTKLGQSYSQIDGTEKKSAWFWCPVRCKDGWNAHLELMDKGIETRHRYRVPLYRQPVLNYSSEQLEELAIRCKMAEKLSGNMIGLPNHPDITDEDIEIIVKEVKPYLK